MRAIVEESVFFRVGDDKCHGVLAYPEVVAPRCLILFLAPHPLLGGNMENNVIRHLAARAAEEGAATLRFNYRGVGESTRDGNTGTVSFFREVEAVREYHLLLPESKAAADYLAESAQQVHPLVLVGYSLGALLAPLLARQMPVALTIGISPPTARTGNACLSDWPGEKIFIAGDEDPFFDLTTFNEAFQALSLPKRFIALENIDHFYRGEEERLYRALRPYLPMQQEAPCSV